MFMDSRTRRDWRSMPSGGQGVEVVNVPLVRCQARGYAPARSP